MAPAAGLQLTPNELYEDGVTAKSAGMARGTEGDEGQSKERTEIRGGWFIEDVLTLSS